jgi:hypothetical protein
MPSLQPRVDFQKRIEAYSTLSANLLTELGELELLREIIRQAEVAAKVRRSVQTRRPAGRETAGRFGYVRPQPTLRFSADSSRGWLRLRSSPSRLHSDC